MFLKRNKDISRLERKLKSELVQMGLDNGFGNLKHLTNRDIIEKITGIRPIRNKNIKFWTIQHPYHKNLLILEGDTYIVKEDIKRIGGQWNNFISNGSNSSYLFYYISFSEMF